MNTLKCPRCKDGVREEGKTACTFCLDAVRARTKRRRDRLVALGLCYRCGKNKVKGTATCKRCLETTRKQNVKSNQKLKLQTFEAYGGPKCACCGEQHMEFLTIDHVKGNGNKHRKELFDVAPGTGRYFYRWLKKNNYPKGYQVLCFNCNVAKHMFGSCPHTRS